MRNVVQPKQMQTEPQTATERLRLKQQQLQMQQQADREQRERENREREQRMLPPGLDDQTPPQRQDSLPNDRPGLPPSKSSPASTMPVTQPGSGAAANSTVGPPPVKPLQRKTRQHTTPYSTAFPKATSTKRTHSRSCTRPFETSSRAMDTSPTPQLLPLSNLPCQSSRLRHG